MKKIFDDYNIHQHIFEKEVRILCTQTNREARPDIFKEKGLFLLPVKNSRYCIIKGEGYVDIPDTDKEVIFV